MEPEAWLIVASALWTAAWGHICYRCGVTAMRRLAVLNGHAFYQPDRLGRPQWYWKPTEEPASDDEEDEDDDPELLLGD